MIQRAVVVGGGAIGVASAYYLTRSGWEVTLIDRGEIGGGCTYGNACLITPSHSHPIAGPGVMAQALRWMLRRDSPFYVRPRLDTELFGWAWKFRRYCNPDAAEKGFEALVGLSRLSLEEFEELAQKMDFFYQRRGLLHVYLSGEGLKAAVRERDTMEEAGFRAQLLSADDTVKLEPAVSDRAAGGLFIEGEAHALSLGYVRALASCIEAEGVKLLTRQPVKGIQVEGRRVQGVALSSSDEGIPAELVVLAAGSWSPDLARTVGLSIPLQPAKGYSCTIDSYSGAPHVPLLMPENRVIVTPLGNRLRFAGTLELAGFNLDIDVRRYRAVVRAAREVLREPFEMRHEESWCGLRPVLPDGLPVIDWAPGIEGLLIATGHAMLGLTQSPGTGKLVAELANGKPSSVPLEPFRYDRF